MDREMAEKLNKEAQELVEIFNLQLNELSSEGNTKVVEALTTLGHIIGKEVQILKESGLDPSDGFTEHRINYFLMLLKGHLNERT